MTHLSICLSVLAATLAFFIGVMVGAVSERKRAVNISERVVSLSLGCDHEFWKGYAAAAERMLLQIKGGAL